MGGALEDAARLLDEYVADEGPTMTLAATLRAYARKLAAFGLTPQADPRPPEAAARSAEGDR